MNKHNVLIVLLTVLLLCFSYAFPLLLLASMFLFYESLQEWSFLVSVLILLFSIMLIILFYLKGKKKLAITISTILLSTGVLVISEMFFSYFGIHSSTCFCQGGCITPCLDEPHPTILLIKGVTQFFATLLVVITGMRYLTKTNRTQDPNDKQSSFFRPFILISGSFLILWIIGMFILANYLPRVPASNMYVCLSESTKIDTPQGSKSVKDIHEGMQVWTLDDDGRRKSVPVLKTIKLRVQQGKFVQLTLANDKTLRLSPGHPTADGRYIGDLQVGDRIDGEEITEIKIIPYINAYTYDILPAGDTGYYWANGVLMGNTLKRN